jgi:UDPglucose 6-dehydrogenase
MTYKVGFIGLGKLGLPCAEAMATVYDVAGYDIYSRESPVVDICSTMKEAVENRDIIFVAVQTPHDPKYDGSTPTSHLDNRDFDYTTVKEVLEELNNYTTGNQLVVLISTVLPGTTRREFIPLVRNYRFIYNPYLIAMGSVAWDMVNPEMVMIGTESGNYTDDATKLINFYKPLMENNPRFVVGTWDEAEAIKIFYNTFISAKLGLVNMIQDVAMKNGNINVDIVTDALAHSDKRIISSKYMTAGMGDGGPCHPRDNIALRYMAQQLDLGYDLFDAIMRAREVQAENIAKFLAELHFKHYMPVVICGKAYKPNVEFTDGSYSTLIGHYLDELDVHYYYADPMVESSFNAPNGMKCIAFLAHNHNVTYGYTGSRQEDQLYVTLLSNSIVVDPWRKYVTDRKDIEVIYYGNTRKK